jgi:hypothetical protein
LEETLRAKSKGNRSTPINGFRSIEILALTRC